MRCKGRPSPLRDRPPGTGASTDSGVTPAIRLLASTAAHASGLRDLIRDPEVRRFTRVPDPPPDDFVDTWLGRYEAGRNEGTREAVTIEDPGDGRLLGIAGAPRV